MQHLSKDRGSTYLRTKHPSIAAVGPIVDQIHRDSYMAESLSIVRAAQQRKRQALAKAFDVRLKLTWFQYFSSVFSLALVVSDVPRSGFGVSQHLTKYPMLEPDVFKFFGPWHYPMLNTSRDDARDTETPVWGYKQDSTSTGLRVFADFFTLTTFPDCNMYRGPCANPVMSQATVFEMLDSLVNATASLKKSSKILDDSASHHASEPVHATLRSSNLYLDRLHHFIVHQVFTNPLWRTSQILYYAPELLLRAETSSATKNICFDFGSVSPGFCHQFWSNFYYSCPAAEPDCRVVGRIWEHTMERVRQVQRMYPTARVDLTLLEGHEDLQRNKGSISPTGMRRDDLVTIVRARQCVGGSSNSSGNENAAANCSTIFISEYRYEIGIVYSDALQWYFIVICLRGAGQFYYYLRIGMLLKFCFNLVSNDADDSTQPQPSVQVRVVKACVLLLKMPVQAIIFGSPLPIVCYAGAHAIDAAITYEVISNIFNSQNGLFTLKFNDLCTVGFNQMRSVWLLALALHAVVQVRASAQRRLSWQPINGIQGVPEFLLSTLAGITMMAQMRIKSLRDTRITSIFEIVETQRLQTIKYQHNLGHHEYGHVTLGGMFIDFKFFVVLIGLLYVALWARRLHIYCTRLSSVQIRAPSLQTKTPVSYAAGVLWPVGAMCIHWPSNYVFVTLPGLRAESIRSATIPVVIKPARASRPLAFVKNCLMFFAMDANTFQYIQSRMKSLHDRDDDVDASIAIMNLVAMSDPLVYFHLVRGGTGEQLGYYQSQRNPEKILLLPCDVVDMPDHYLNELELVCKVQSCDLSFADLIHCG